MSLQAYEYKDSAQGINSHSYLLLCKEGNKPNPSMSVCVSGSKQMLCVPFLTTTSNAYTFLLQLSLTCSLILRLHFYQNLSAYSDQSLSFQFRCYSEIFWLIYRIGSGSSNMSSPNSLNLPTINFITC